MLEPQATELPHEVEYGLDVATESCEIDAASRIVLVVYGDRRTVTDIMTSDPARIVNIRVPLSSEDSIMLRLNREGKARACVAYAGELLGQLTRAHQIAAADMAIAHLMHAVRDMAWMFAYWSITDSCEGGALSPLQRPRAAIEVDDRRPARTGRDRYAVDGLFGSERISPKARRRLYSRRWVRRYIGTMKEANRMRELLAIAVRRDCADATETERAAAAGIFDADFEEHRRRLETASRLKWSAMIGSAVNRKSSRADAQKARKIAKRSAAFAAGVIGSAEVGRFIRGEEIVLEGQELALKVGKRANLLMGANGPNAIDVKVCDKQHTDLASLCVYMRSTPPLDQLAGLALAMSAGEELDVLADANVVRVTKAGAGHPALAGRVSSHDEDGFPRIRIAMGSPVERRNRAYWDATREMWMDELGTFVFGPGWRKTRGKAF